MESRAGVPTWLWEVIQAAVYLNSSSPPPASCALWELAAGLEASLESASCFKSASGQLSSLILVCCGSLERELTKNDQEPKITV
jgi:hypothetical protein